MPSRSGGNSSGVTERNGGGDRSSFLARPQFKVTFDLSHALAHAAQANAVLAGPVLARQLEVIEVDACTLVRNPQDKVVVIEQQANVGGGAARMAVHICKGFLQDTKDGEFHVGRQTTESWGNFKSCPDAAALGESIEIPGDGRFESHLFQHGRIKKI